MHIDEHEAFLGRLVVAFQSVELALIEFFASLISWQERDLGYIVSDGLSFKKLVGVVDALARYHKVMDDSLSQLLSECLTLEEKRNHYVHGYWQAESTPELKLRWVLFKRRNRVGKGNRLSEEKLSVAVDKFIDQCRDIEPKIKQRIRKREIA